jgi:hypothetical protein
MPQILLTFLSFHRYLRKNINTIFSSTSPNYYPLSLFYGNLSFKKGPEVTSEKCNIYFKK